MIGASKLFGLLADDTRRRLLLLLREEGSLQVPDAVLERGSVAASHERSADEPRGSRSHELTETQLYHVHLPKLESEGLIEWERDTAVVTRGERFDEMEPLLELLSENASQVPQRVF